MVSILAAVMLLAWFRSSGLEEITAVSAAVSGVHVFHLSKLLVKVFKWGFEL
jgi:hypothetical protein